MAVPVDLTGGVDERIEVEVEEDGVLACHGVHGAGDEGERRITNARHGARAGLPPPPASTPPRYQAAVEAADSSMKTLSKKHFPPPSRFTSAQVWPPQRRRCRARRRREYPRRLSTALRLGLGGGVVGHAVRRRCGHDAADVEELELAAPGEVHGGGDDDAGALGGAGRGGQGQAQGLVGFAVEVDVDVGAELRRRAASGRRRVAGSRVVTVTAVAVVEGALGDVHL